MQLCDVASGLEYLHSKSLVHGDLKGVCKPHLLIILQSLTCPGQYAREC